MQAAVIAAGAAQSSSKWPPRASMTGIAPDRFIEPIAKRRGLAKMTLSAGWFPPEIAAQLWEKTEFMAKAKSPLLALYAI